MKSITNYTYTPDTHWTTWCEQSDWSFVDNRELWEHPAISPLAKETRPAYWEIDLDSDSILADMLLDHWLEDILSRKDEVSIELYYKVLEYKDFCVIDAENPAHQKYLDYYLSVSDNKEDIEDKNYLSILIEYKYECGREDMLSVLQDILYLIVATNYSPKEEHVYTSFEEELKLGHPEKYDEYKCYESVYNNIVEYLIEEAHGIYLTMVKMYPAENLAHYLHDQALFMNYIQEIVLHEQEDDYKDSLPREKYIVLNETLIDDTPDLEDIKYLLSRLSTFWTRKGTIK